MTLNSDVMRRYYLGEGGLMTTLVLRNLMGGSEGKSDDEK